MGVDFIGNPYEQDELVDSDFEGTTEDDWITLPNDVVILDGRAHLGNTLDPTLGMPDSSDEDSWPNEVDDDDDYDYDPADDEYIHDEYEANDDGEIAPELDDINVRFFFGHSHHQSDDDEDEDEYDYVTFPVNRPVSDTGSPPEIVKTSEELNTNNPDNADAD